MDPRLNNALKSLDTKRALMTNYAPMLEPGINVCPVCLLTARETKLKRCGACYKISYCSQEHQKKHWRKHKELCKIILRIEKVLPESDVENWENYQKDMRLCLEKFESETNKFLSTNQIFTILQAGRCEVCHRKNSQIVCLACMDVNYCSKEHLDLDSDHHSKICRDHKLMTEVFLYLEKDLPLPTFSLRNGTLTLPENIEKFVESNMEVSIVNPDSKDCEIAMVANTVSHSLSLLFGLKCLNFKTEDTLIIHIVGSSWDESAHLLQWEIILHIYPNIKELTLILIGPEVVPPIHRSMCNRCKNIMKIRLSNDFYHEYVESSEYQEPNIVCGFNAGISAYPSWKPSLRFLIKSAPFILSSFSEKEAQDDIECVLDVKPDIIVQSERNPFSALHPLTRNWDNQVSFLNKIVTVFSNMPIS